MIEETSPRGLPTTTGFAARETLAMLRKRNIATAPLLLRAGLSEHGLARAADEGNGLPQRVSAIGQCKFLDYAAEAMDDSAFGLHLAGQIDPRDVGLYFYAGSAARDLGEALALFSRYCRIVNEAFRQKLTQRSNDLAIEVEFVGLPRYAARHNMEFAVAGIRTALRTITGRNVTPTSVTFGHNRNSDLREFERFFGCPVEFGAPNTVFQISTDALRLPLITADPKLLRILRPYCDAAAKDRNVKPGTLRSAVEAEVEKLLPHGKAKAENVAQALASACAPSREGWPMKAQHTARLSTNCGRASRLNISAIPGCRSGRLRGCLGTRGRPRSIMLSSAGRDGRLPLIGTGERTPSLGVKRQGFGRL
jgi:hypothetical protein